MSERDINATDAVEPKAAGATEVDIEAPEADAVEQHLSVNDDEGAPPPRIPFDADEADAADQRLVVELDEDDYR